MSAPATVHTTYREAIREAIRDAMKRDPRVFLMGEDVGHYGGCFAVSLGLLEEFGPERIMFGSDWPVCLLATSYDMWVSAATALTAGLTAAERAAVFGGTAARWYGL